MDNLVLFDWLSATLPVQSDWPCDGSPIDGSCFINLLGMQNVSFEVSNGVKGFSKRLWFDGVNIHLPSDKMPFCWLEMSGSGCRAFETYGHGNWNQLLNVIIQYCNITRLDVAFDDHSGILDMPTIVQDTFFQPCYVSRSSKHDLEMSINDKTGERGYTVYHGSPASDLRIRIYDKAAQLRRESEHWNRVEIELKDTNAQSFISSYLQSCNLGDLFCGVLLYNLRYCEPDDSDSNKWRWPLKGYWSKLMSSVQPIRLLSSPGAEYNIVNLDNFVFSQAGNSIRTYIECFGIDKFLSRLKETRPFDIPPKYKEFLSKYKCGDRDEG